MPEYRYELRRGDQVIATGHFRREEPVEAATGSGSTASPDRALDRAASRRARTASRRAALARAVCPVTFAVSEYDPPFVRRGWSTNLDERFASLPSPQRSSWRFDFAVADSPAALVAGEPVFVGHASARAVLVDGDSFGSGVCLVVCVLGEDDVRDVMAYGVCLAQRERGVSNRWYPLERSEAKVREVIR